MRDSISLSIIYFDLTEIYESQKQYDSTFYYLKKEQDLSIEERLIEQKKSILELERDKDNLRIQLEEKRLAEKLDVVSREQRNLLYALSFLVVLLLPISVLWKRIIKKNQENKQQKHEIAIKNQALEKTLAERNIVLGVKPVVVRLQASFVNFYD